MKYGLLEGMVASFLGHLGVPARYSDVQGNTNSLFIGTLTTKGLSSKHLKQQGLGTLGPQFRVFVGMLRVRRKAFYHHVSGPVGNASVHGGCFWLQSSA